MTEKIDGAFWAYPALFCRPFLTYENGRGTWLPGGARTTTRTPPLSQLGVDFSAASAPSANACTQLFG